MKKKKNVLQNLLLPIKNLLFRMKKKKNNAGELIIAKNLFFKIPKKEKQQQN
jgi:hypothetical protein